jgi:Signal peptidase (SPase) II
MENSQTRLAWFWGPYSALGLAVALATFAIDQAHKWWMLYVYDIASKGRVAVTSFLDLVFVKNTGISYSMFDDGGMTGQYLLAGFAVVASYKISARAGRHVTALGPGPHHRRGAGERPRQAAFGWRRGLLLAACIWVLLVRF